MFSLRVAIHGDLLKALRRPITRTPVYTVFTLQNLRVCLLRSCCYSYFLLAHLLTSWNKTHSRKHEARYAWHHQERGGSSLSFFIWNEVFLNNKERITGLLKKF